MPTLVANGTPIAYEDSGPPAGSPAAPTIVFGHGLLFSGWMFHPQVEGLSTHYRCVTIDWRGQGATPPTRTGDYGMDTLFGDAVAVIEHLGTAPVHYVGLSMGGFVGQRIGARRGELLRSLTLLDTSPDREPVRSAVEDIAMATIYRYLGIGLLKAPVAKIMFGPTFRAEPKSGPVVDEFLARLRRLDRAGLRHAIVAVATRKPVYDELDRISVPTLVIVGADDVPTPPAKGRRIAERIRGAQLEIIPECGHSATVEQPEIVTGLLRGFLAAVDAG